MNKQEIAVGALSGGNSDNGGNAGPRYLNSNNSASNTGSNIGAALVNFNAAILLPKRKTFQFPGNGVLVAGKAKTRCREFTSNYGQD